MVLISSPSAAEAGYTADSSGAGRTSRRISSHWSRVRRKKGCVSYNRRAMPARCGPWPVNRKTGSAVDPGPAGAAPPERPSSSPSPGSSRTKSASRSASSPGVAPTAARRCGKCGRPVFAEKLRSAALPGPAFASRSW